MVKTFLLSLAPTCNGVYRTCLLTPVSYTHLLSRVFYCDPMASWQKGRLEKNHEFIRYIIPKGTTFAGLDQEQVLSLIHISGTATHHEWPGCLSEA